MWEKWEPLSQKRDNNAKLELASVDADDTTLMEENEEELTASWWKWKRRVKKLA